MCDKMKKKDYPVKTKKVGQHQYVLKKLKTFANNISY